MSNSEARARLMDMKFRPLTRDDEAWLIEQLETAWKENEEHKKAYEWLMKMRIQDEQERKSK